MKDNLGKVNLENVVAGVLQIQERQLGSDELIKARIKMNEDIILGLANQFEEHGKEVRTLVDRMDNIEWNEEITDEQVRAIQARIKERVSKVLNYPSGDSVIYYRTFISDLYTKLRHSYNLGSRTATTRKKHYDTVIKGIEAWHPNLQELKDRKDKRDKSLEEII